MNTIKIAEILEQAMIDAVAENLEKRMTITDFGIQLDDDEKQVYRTHILVNLNVIQDTPVDNCRTADNPVKARRISDKERLRLLASELLGLLK